MKKVIVSALLLIAVTTGVKAQGFHLGGKIGANLNKISGQPFKEGYNLGYHLGGFAEIDVNKNWGIQPEVLWNQVNTTYAEDFNAITQNLKDSVGSLKLHYLSIPILFRYNVGSLVTLNLGPQFGILLDQDKTLLTNGKEAFKSGDFSLVAGATINLKTLRVYGRYNIGLSNISDATKQDKWKSQQVQLGIGLRLL